jgi:hypothetical protein
MPRASKIKTKPVIANGIVATPGANMQSSNSTAIGANYRMLSMKLAKETLSTGVMRSREGVGIIAGMSTIDAIVRTEGKIAQAGTGVITLPVDAAGLTLDSLIGIKRDAVKLEGKYIAVKGMVKDQSELIQAQADKLKSYKEAEIDPLLDEKRRKIEETFRKIRDDVSTDGEVEGLDEFLSMVPGFEDE